VPKRGNTCLQAVTNRLQLDSSLSAIISESAVNAGRNLLIYGG
jgi:hypothetical protein